jgi:hypothetical protein
MGENSKSTQTLEELTVCVGDGNLLKWTLSSIYERAWIFPMFTLSTKIGTTLHRAWRSLSPLAHV